MKKQLLGFVVLLITAGLVVALSQSWGSIPALGRFFSPTEGLWRNAETGGPVQWGEVALRGLQKPVRIQYDERLVPHIYAETQEDLYFAQGYVTAQLRLFQLDFQTRAAAGRISEILGPTAQNFDLRMRRLGLLYAAERAVEEIQKDEATRKIVDAYTAGINAYLEELTPADYPIEYKLLGFAPEAWSPLRAALLLKQMALTLSFEGSDFEMSQVLTVLGREKTNLLFPNYPPYQDPIIPAGTPVEGDILAAQAVPDSFELSADRSANLAGGWQLPKASPDIGSNNWVVSAEKSATGYPILANDPHLGLTLPSIWFEMHLVGPEVNVYGVSLPGSPGIVIGFNEDVAWGVTNVGADVVDWYQIEFVDTTTFEKYRYDGAERLTTVREEVIRRKGAEDLVDTLRFTHHGPLPYLNVRYHPQRFQAMRWLAHEPSNELRTFLELNRAKSHADYLQALRHFSCPAQNFVFADNQKNIALWVNGKFPLKAPGQGKYVSAGNTSKTEWQGWIPQQQNPHAHNPARGFLSSANQQSAGPEYPYYIDWDQEPWERGARINQRLAAMQRATPDSLRALQNDNFGLLAHKLLPTLLDTLALATLSEPAKAAYDTLKAWDFRYERWATAATVFETWRALLFEAVWQDDLDSLAYPHRDMTTYLLLSEEGTPWIDDRRTPETETLRELAAQTLNQAVDSLQRQHGPWSEQWQWGAHKNTTVKYLLSLPPFARFNRSGLPIGGGRGIVNATRESNGPSWRMVVAVGPEGPTAFGIYPGGQSGNPGSVYYDNFVDTWANGELKALRFTPKPAEEGMLGEVTLRPRQ